MTVKDFSSQIFGIAGMGIGLGLLAHTMRNVTRITDDLYKPQNQKRTRRTTRPQYQYRPYRWRF